MFAGLIGMMAASVIVTVAGPPPAPTPPPSPPAAAVPAPAVNKNPMDQIECRRTDETGSRLGGKRVCKTRQEWLDAAREARSITEGVQNQSLTQKTPGS